MKKTIETDVIIQAPLEKVWKVLTDYDDYGYWSPTIKFFDGIPEVGKRTAVRLELPNSYSVMMNSIFIKIDLNQELRWKGRLMFIGLFDGEHYFILGKITAHQTLFIQGEIFSGLFVPFFKKMIDGSTLKGFELFNQILRSRVEISNYKY